MSVTRLVKVDELTVKLKEKVSVTAVAEILGVDLHTAGDQLTGLCPLHAENTPSFYINEHKGINGVYKCWGCKASGDAIDLIRQGENLEFFEALYRLAEIGEFPIDEYERPMTEAEKEEQKTAVWSEAMLAGGSLPSRGDPATLALYGVSQSPRRNVPEDWPHYFRDKSWLLDGVLFPYRRPNGRLVGWRLREHPGTEKRAIGTPSDFPLGKVVDNLFGIREARDKLRQRPDLSLVIVEGEYDALAVVAAGIEQPVVAMGGSNLTPGQLQLLKDMHVKHITLLFDGDKAGIEAAKVHARRLWDDADIVVRVTTCIRDLDPEEMIETFGPISVQMMIDNARGALESLLHARWIGLENGSARDMTSKLEYIRWIGEEFGGKLQGAQYDVVLGEVAGWLGIPELDVRDFVRTQGAELEAVDSERILLGKAMRDKKYYTSLRQRLARDDFFMLRHQRLWDTLETVMIEGHDFDLTTVTAYAERLGVPEDYVQGTHESPETNLEFHLGRVTDLSLRRSARDDAVAFRDRIADLSQPAEILVGDLTARVTQKALRKTGADQRILQDQVDDAMDQLHARMKNPSGVHGMNLGTQFPRTSQLLQGVQDRRLILVSAVSGVGKSSVMIAWAGSLAVHQSLPIDFISLEMDESEILYKLCAHLTGIDSMKITGGSLDPDEARRVEQAMVRIRRSPLHIWAPDGLTASEFVLYARESTMRRRTRGFFLDYVQLTDPDPGMERENGYIQFGHFGRLAKMKVARSMEVAVVCAAQLNRNAATKERPTKEDMGDSYALVRHSDVILILHGQEEGAKLDMWIDKNRQGPGGQLVPLYHDKQTTTFYEVSNGHKEPEYLIR